MVFAIQRAAALGADLGEDACEPAAEMQLPALTADPEIDHAQSPGCVRVPSFRIH